MVKLQVFKHGAVLHHRNANFFCFFKGSMFLVHDDTADVVMHFLFTHPAHACGFAKVFAKAKGDGKVEVILMVFDYFKIEEAYCFWHERSPVK